MTMLAHKLSKGKRERESSFWVHWLPQASMGARKNISCAWSLRFFWLFWMLNTFLAFFSEITLLFYRRNKNHHHGHWKQVGATFLSRKIISLYSNMQNFGGNGERNDWWCFKRAEANEPIDLQRNHSHNVAAPCHSFMIVIALGLSFRITSCRAAFVFEWNCAKFINVVFLLLAEIEKTNIEIF